MKDEGEGVAEGGEVGEEEVGGGVVSALVEEDAFDGAHEETEDVEDGEGEDGGRDGGWRRGDLMAFHHLLRQGFDEKMLREKVSICTMDYGRR